MGFDDYVFSQLTPVFPVCILCIRYSEKRELERLAALEEEGKERRIALRAERERRRRRSSVNSNSTKGMINAINSQLRVGSGKGSTGNASSVPRNTKSVEALREARRKERRIVDAVVTSFISHHIDS
jgi:hypothetical protein